MATRRSTRARKPVKRLSVDFEDELPVPQKTQKRRRRRRQHLSDSEDEEFVPYAPAPASARKRGRAATKRGATVDMCLMCNQDIKGDVVCCGSCGVTFCEPCSGVDAAELWECADCLILEEEQRCRVCGKATEPRRMALCSLCGSFTHYACADPPLQRKPRASWTCSDCVSSDMEVTAAPPGNPYAEQDKLLSAEAVAYLKQELADMQSITQHVEEQAAEPWPLPPSSIDLPLSNDDVMSALECYEVLRYFGRYICLAPFLFEDMCQALLQQESGELLGAIHHALLQPLLYDIFDGDSQGIWASLEVSLLDSTVWPAVLLRYFEQRQLYQDSFSEDAAAMCHRLQQQDYRDLSLQTKLHILTFLVRELCAGNLVLSVVDNGGLPYDSDQCQKCEKPGELVICEQCLLGHHLECAKLKDVPEEEWYCDKCLKEKLSGVTDCVIPHEKDGIIRGHLLGVDSAGRRYYFAARRVEAARGKCWYYSTPNEFQTLLQVLEQHSHEDLLENLKNLEEEILRQMRLTYSLSVAARQRRPVRAPGSSSELGTAVDQRALALEANTDAVSVGPWYRLGDELNCFTWSNTMDIPWVEGVENIATQFYVDAPRWQGFLCGPSQEPTLLSQFAIVRQQLTVIEQSIPWCFYHADWLVHRKPWREAVLRATTEQHLMVAMAVLHAAIRDVVQAQISSQFTWVLQTFCEAWHQVSIEDGISSLSSWNRVVESTRAVPPRGPVFPTLPKRKSRIPRRVLQSPEPVQLSYSDCGVSGLTWHWTSPRRKVIRQQAVKRKPLLDICDKLAQLSQERRMQDEYRGTCYSPSCNDKSRCFSPTCPNRFVTAVSCDALPEPKPDPVALTPHKRSSQDLFSIAAEFTAGIGSKRDRSSRRATLDYGTSCTPRRSKPTFPTLPKTSPELRVSLINQQWRCGRGIADCFHCPSEQLQILARKAGLAHLPGFVYKAFALVPNFRRVWQAAVSRCTRVDQAAILLKVLESSILWQSWLSGALSSRYKEDHMIFTLLKRRFARHAREYLMKTETQGDNGRQESSEQWISEDEVPELLLIKNFEEGRAKRISFLQSRERSTNAQPGSLVGDAEEYMTAIKEGLAPRLEYNVWVKGAGGQLPQPASFLSAKQGHEEGEKQRLLTLQREAELKEKQLEERRRREEFVKTALEYRDQQQVKRILDGLIKTLQQREKAEQSEARRKRKIQQTAATLQQETDILWGAMRDTLDSILSGATRVRRPRKKPRRMSTPPALRPTPSNPSPAASTSTKHLQKPKLVRVKTSSTIITPPKQPKPSASSPTKPKCGSVGGSPSASSVFSDSSLKARSPSVKIVLPVSLEPRPKLKTIVRPPKRRKLSELPLTAERLLAISTVLRTLMQQKAAIPFLQPVDRAIVPDYYDVVRAPMDLTTLRHSVQNGKYGNVAEFVKDVKLIFDNCRLYNPLDSPYVQMAGRLEATFQGMLAQIIEA